VHVASETRRTHTPCSKVDLFPDAKIRNVPRQRTGDVLKDGGENKGYWLAWMTVVGWNEEGRRRRSWNKKAIAQIAWPDNEWQELKQDDETTARVKRERESEEEGEKKDLDEKNLFHGRNQATPPAATVLPRAPTTGQGAGPARGEVAQISPGNGALGGVSGTWART
jgi:hypothetical protein